MTAGSLLSWLLCGLIVGLVPGSWFRGGST
jgi:hypothetical protein